MLAFPDPSVDTEYTDPNGSVWEFNGTGWVRQPASSGDDAGGGGGGGGGGNTSLSGPSGTGLTTYRADTSLWSDVVFLDDIDPTVGNLNLSEGLRVDDNNFLLTNANSRQDEQAFFWIKNDGKKVTDVIHLPCPYEGTGDGQIGNLGLGALQNFMSHCSVVIDGKVYMVTGNSRIFQEIIEISESGVRNVTWAPECNTDTATWKFYRTERLCGWSDAITPAQDIPFLFRSGDDEVTTIQDGYSVSTNNYVAKFCRYGLDGTFRGEYESPLPSHAGFGTRPEWYGGWKQDPANEKAAVGVFWVRERNLTVQPLFIYYADLESGDVTCVDCGTNSNLTILAGNRPNMNFYPTDANTWYLEFDHYPTSTTMAQYAWAFDFPADRQNIGTDMRISFINSQRIDCTDLAKIKYRASQSNCWYDRKNPFISFDRKAMFDGRRMTPGFGSYEDKIRLKNRWGNLTYAPKFADRAFAEVMPGAAITGKPGYGEFSISNSYAYGYKTYAIAVAEATSFSEDNRSANAFLMSVRADNSAALFYGTWYDSVAKVSRKFVYLREPGDPSDLRLMAKVINGKVVGKPTVPRLEDTSGPEWVDVISVVDDLGEFEKLGEITYEYDEKINKVALRRSAVAMTEAEILEAKLLTEEQGNDS